MKFTALAITLLSTSTDAFSPSFLKKSSSAATTTTIKSDAASVAADMGIDKPVYDPLGLYPKNAPERQAGLIQPLESSSAVVAVDQGVMVMDPLGLYQGQEQASLSRSTAGVAPEMSASLPFLERPQYLDGSLAGDRGFDPFNFASSPEALSTFRNSELKHARLAMLAAVGWPLAELFHKPLAEAWNLPQALNLHDRVPSVLNGGLDKVSPVFWVVALAAAATVEAFSGSVGEVQSPDLGFDPLGLANNGGEKKAFMEESELFNGRLAMLAITGFAIQESFTGNSVVDAIPIFFKPLNVAMEQLLLR